MNIVLTGPMGSGKTVVGKRLAHKLSMNFLDTDHIIEQETGCLISDYFDQFGEKKFRLKEKQIISKVSQLDNHVIATGGGVVLNPVNMRNLRRNALIINLNARVETLQHRLKESKNNRPLLQSGSLEKKLDQYSKGRAKQYNNADYCVQTDSLSVDAVVSEITRLLNLPRIRICASIAGDKIIDQIHSTNSSGASFIELRLDLIEEVTIPRFIQESGLPVIATDRRNHNNLLTAIDAGCDFIDVDFNHPMKEQIISCAREKGCRVIVSIHDYKQTPESISLPKIQGDYLKIATTIHSYKDSVTLLQLLHKQENLIIIGMGKNGTYTRVIAPLLGSFLTYASVNQSTAPGQFSLKNMISMYKAMGVK